MARPIEIYGIILSTCVPHSAKFSLVFNYLQNLLNRDSISSKGSYDETNITMIAYSTLGGKTDKLDEAVNRELNVT